LENDLVRPNFCKLKRVRDPSGKIRRLAQTGETIHNIHDADGNRIAEYDGTGAVIREYIWLDGRPLAVVEGGQTYQLDWDQIGRPVAGERSELGQDQSSECFGRMTGLSALLPTCWAKPNARFGSCTDLRDPTAQRLECDDEMVYRGGCA
jgi:YD repeat-containing protein